MRKVIELILVFCIIYSIIELGVILLSNLLVNFYGYLDAEAITSSRTIIFQILICLIVASLYTKWYKK